MIELLYQCKENGIDVLLNEGQLQLKLPKNKVFDKSLIEEIKANKELILSFLKKNERGGKTNYKINRIDRSTISHIPLSFAQERLWFVDQLEGTIPYHLPSILRLKGKLDKQALSFALKSVLDRHEVLRTVILSEEGTGYQLIRDTRGWQLNISNLPELLNNQEGLEQRIEKLVKAPFDLSKDYMLRADLLCMADEHSVLVTTMHHIASDGWSSSVLVREIIELYESSVENRAPRVESLPIQYADYAAWQRNYLVGDLLDKKIAYWKEKLDGVTSIELPIDFARPPVQSTKGAVIRFTVDKEVSLQLQELSRQQGVTLFMTLLSALKVLLFRYTGQQDICVGTGLAGRQHKELEGLIGFFVNMLALRSEVKADLPFTELLQNLKATTLEAYEHQDLPFEKVVNAIVEERDTSRSPLFQVLFEMQNNPEIPQLRLGEVQLIPEPFEQRISKFDITFFIKSTATGLQGSIQYATDLFREETILRMLSHYKELLSSIAKRPDQKVGELQMLTGEEQRQLLVGFNNTATTQVKRNETIVNLFEAQAAKTAENIALISKEQQFTYRQLNDRSNQLAHYLQTKGVGAGTLVPVFLERSPDMIIAILAILKAGAAYVPVDPEYPFERISYLLNDIGAVIVISNNDGVIKLQQAADIEIILTDDEWSALDSQPKTNLQAPIRAADFAYVIYTSGSTGQPKGVMIEHGALLNYLVNDKTKYLSDNNEGAGTFLHLSYTFDASITGIFMPLLAGKSLVLGGKQGVEVFEDENLLKYAPYDFIKLTPSHLPLLEPVFRTNRTLTKRLVVGGEALRLSQFDYLIDNVVDVEIVNEYGPTEATVGCSTYRLQTITGGEKIEENAGISIGKPIDNVSIYILDNENNLLPIGIGGEICIGGTGLASGYLNREELTKQKFIKNPFSKEEDSRLYKTGDIGKWAADGNIEYIGRKDDQVKIRGYRIEPGEIESCLSSIEGVKDAKVLLSENDVVTSKILNAYIQVDREIFPELSEHLQRLKIREEAVVSTGPQEFVKAIRANLQARLPAYMLPANIILLDQFPITTNGKIDKKALPKTEIGSEAIENETGIVAETETEKALIDIWKDLLGLETVGVHDNFFNLGGDSIITIQLASRARGAGFELAVADIFTHQTISKLARHLEQTANSSLEVTGEQGVLTGYAGLLPIQQWYFENASTDVSHFNQSVLLGIDKIITETVLQAAVESLIIHHDALRFRYRQQNGAWQQEYDSYKGKVITEDLQQVPDERLVELITERATAHQKSLDIEKGELIRIVLIKTPFSQINNRLFIVIHHLAIDGVSWRILLEDLEKLLTAATNNEKANLGRKSSSYRQWYTALKEYGQSKSMLPQKKYWKQSAFENGSLPVDNPFVGEIKIKDICSKVVRLEAEKTRQLLQEVPRVFHTEVNDILLCALTSTLCDWSNRDKLVIGLEGHGREQVAEGIDTSRTVGWFTTLFPVSLSGDRDQKAGDLIKTVKEQLRQVPDKGIGYGVLKYINKEQNMQGKDPWEVVFNYMGQIENAVREDKLLSIAEGSTGQGINDEHIVNEKLGIHSSVRSGELVLNWTYSKKNYKEETIDKLAKAYLSNLKRLIDHALEQGKLTEVFTPADFGLGKEIGYKELDAFLEEDNHDNIMSF